MSGEVLELPLEFDDLTSDRIQGQPGFVQAGDSIRFGASGPEYCFVPGDPHAVTMWAADPQTPANTPWPRGQNLPFGSIASRIALLPACSNSSAGKAIDLAWSCIGTRPLFRIPL